MKKILFILAIVLLIPAMVQAATVTLTWNSSKDATGYKVFYGKISRTYEPTIDVKNVLSYSMDLPTGVRYFAVKAYNQWGESTFSEEAILLDAPEFKTILMVK